MNHEVHYCRACQPRVFDLPADPLHKRHRSIRWDLCSDVTVVIGGRNVTRWCQEAAGGVDGFAVLLGGWETDDHPDVRNDGVHVCSCGSDEPCTMLYLGPVQVTSSRAA